MNELDRIHARIDDIATVAQSWTATIDHLIEAIQAFRETAERLDRAVRTLTTDTLALHEAVRRLPCREESRDTWPAPPPPSCPIESAQ